MLLHKFIFGLLLIYIEVIIISHNFLSILSLDDRNYFIITEFTKNIDGYCLSTFLYNKDISAKSPKFYLGPIWDYNFSLGLTDYREGYSPEGYVYKSNKYI